ncbi:SDR family oxidoreductase [Paenibacillus sp. J2TS4]|uniref:SDR family oxidoreductase n=1 Tax=Paenibacillus sp. J2TS4 TaxID=2807194 RepID=UPI001B2AC939|nr:SDR family oxidoreductase [Paenibacillus sp. J2TS4]GIP34968.1 hypothetical protein J2TS4_41780 [Paenibacillus sp. J2TS4]
MNLRDQVCVVTGAARGIGLSIARHLIDTGAKVALCDVDEAPLKEACAALPAGRHLAITLDVVSESAIAGAVDTVAALWGGISVWINNAGVARHQSVLDISEREIDLMLSVNAKGTILGSKQALLHMKNGRRGHIVNIISTAGMNGVPGQSVYCASKFAVRGFTAALQEEAAACGVRVSAVYPGGVDTAFWDKARDSKPPVELFLTADHIARAVISVLQTDDFCVVREIVLRSIRDVDTIVPEPEDGR